MKRSLLLVIAAILLVGSILLGLIDTDSSIAHTGILYDEAASSVGNNPSGNATVTITMYAVDDK